MNKICPFQSPGEAGVQCIKNKCAMWINDHGGCAILNMAKTLQEVKELAKTSVWN